MEIVVYVCLGIVVVAMFLALARMERGPSTLDRAVATDVITAAVVALIGLLIAWTGDASYVPILVVLTLVGFLTTVSIARFTAVEKSDEARILTREELAQVLERERQLDDDDAPVHGPDSPRVTGEEEEANAEAEQAAQAQDAVEAQGAADAQGGAEAGQDHGEQAPTVPGRNGEETS